MNNNNLKQNKYIFYYTILIIKHKKHTKLIFIKNLMKNNLEFEQ